jgi:hypothetical protein
VRQHGGYCDALAGCAEGGSVALAALLGTAHVRWQLVTRESCLPAAPCTVQHQQHSAITHSCCAGGLSSTFSFLACRADKQVVRIPELQLSCCHQ